ncbi:CCR4-NOT transcription complex subunit 2-like isoform X2 [Macrosteles quadrilineatus]|uniref:CCR4-NOT transcription complex subunit 2-like isoform X2 n=1 Tax=Macrosteles quadrilineatus TaxID=74068 RepID=UPI0023E0BB82|nr:CCR4-NOT transcription complex subunit 2-like isoform X2 [Macrosteles quadrilineatus]XP_054273165.1 CCR4-NOT transcription complex subunit 2-like isoform X2 [Macrosteles quadrilineatus]
MANLNFQQPPRSIANQGLSRTGFGTSSLSGHVTPTSGMFQGSSSSFTPQQLSPNRNLPPMTNRNLFGQRAFPERRPVPALSSVMQEWSSNPMGSMGSFGIPQNRTFGSQGAMSNFHSVFGGGGGGDTSTPPLLDLSLSEFPSLTNRGQGDSMPQPSTMPGKQPYVGMVKQPTSESSEFTMSSEDFPALPGTASTEGPSPGGSVVSGGGDKTTPASDQPPASQDLVNSRLVLSNDKSLALKRGIQTSPDGKVTNIPSSMVKDQFGMVGLLTFIRAAETDPNLVSLALGQDLTALGLNLNSPDNLYPTFGGPWAEMPCRPQDIDYHVPPEYIINHSIREKLAPIKLSRYKDDLLFFMYYTNMGDVLQIAAAAELYTREWRYHMEEKVWITQAPGYGAVEKTSTYERGTYYFFDAQNWRKVPKEFHLDYSKLENRPSIPQQLHSV